MATPSPKLPQHADDGLHTSYSVQEQAIQDDAAHAAEMQVNANAQKQTSLPQTITPEPRPDQQPANNQAQTPSTPGIYLPFNWEEFEARYEKALQDADSHERELLNEFDQLVKYFNIWASASSAHDNERAAKRLQTRQRYVTLAEDRMSQRQQHYSEVMRAFQSALALLSQPSS